MKHLVLYPVRTSCTIPCILCGTVLLFCFIFDLFFTFFFFFFFLLDLNWACYIVVVVFVFKIITRKISCSSSSWNESWLGNFGTTDINIKLDGIQQPVRKKIRFASAIHIEHCTQTKSTRERFELPNGFPYIFCHISSKKVYNSSFEAPYNFSYVNINLISHL